MVDQIHIDDLMLKEIILKVSEYYRHGKSFIFNDLTLKKGIQR
jgi:hypothetical protein